MYRKFNELLTIILAGGHGERLYPLTKDRAKPSVPFGGVYRIIDFTLSNCINSGIRKMYLLTQYKSDSLERHLKAGWNFLNPDLGEFIMSIPPQFRASNKWYQGTADAIFQNIYTLQLERPKLVFLLSGDHIYKMDYMQMLNYHLDKKADVTVGAVEFELENARSFGIIEIDSDNRIIGFEEKPEKPKSMPLKPDKALVSMGVYLFETDELVKAVVSNAKSDNEHDIGKNIIPELIKKKKVYAYEFKDENKKDVLYWRDIGTLKSYFDAHMDLVEISPIFNLYDDAWPIRTYQPQHPPAKMVFFEEHPGGRIGGAYNSLLSAGCIISGGKVVKSILSPCVRINSFSYVESSILFEGVDIGRYSVVKNAIIDKSVKVPANTQIGIDLNQDKERFTVSPEGIVAIPKGYQFE